MLDKVLNALKMHEWSNKFHLWMNLGYIMQTWCLIWMNAYDDIIVCYVPIFMKQIGSFTQLGQMNQNLLTTLHMKA